MGRGGLGLRGVFHACGPAVAFAAISLASCASHVPTLGVDLPLAGPDGGRGILAMQAVRLAISEHRAYALQIDVRDASGGGFANPHEDEGAGDWRNPIFAAKNIAALAGSGAVIGVLGGFDEPIARAEMRVARRSRLPIVLASRSSALALHGSQSAQFQAAYRQRYGEAPDELAERYYTATKLILNCGSHSRAELAACLRKAT